MTIARGLDYGRVAKKALDASGAAARARRDLKIELGLAFVGGFLGASLWILL